MTLDVYLNNFGIKLSHIYQICDNNSISARFTQTGKTKLPLFGRKVHNYNIIPYMDTVMTMIREGVDSREITSVKFKGGDFSDEYILNFKDNTITLNGEII